jgi:hypothetical protein
MQKSPNVFRSIWLWRALVIGICSCAGFLIITYQFIGLVKMDSTSMDSTEEISKGLLSIKKDDAALILKHFRHPLLNGDLVVVTYNNSRDNKPVTTVRRIAGVPGDTTKNGVTIQDGYYYLLGDSTNAIDSRQLGLFRYAQVSGKVVWVIK